MNKITKYKTSLDTDKIKKVKLCYQANHDLPLIVGMNDSMGVNTGFNPFGKSFFDILNKQLSSNDMKAEVIPCFSLLFNKTEHVDYFLRQNVSLEEIKYMQVYGLEEAVYKLLRDWNLPHSIANLLKHVAYLMKITYHPNKKDKEIHISDALRNSKQPIFIYSSGPNDLMRIYGNNPFAIKGSYRNREKDPSFDYTVKQIQNPELLNQVITDVENNIKLIRDINPSTNIFMLGSFVPKAFDKEEMNIFRNIILEYNERLKELCEKHQLHFIDTYELGELFNTSKINFHLNQKGHYALANEVLDLLYTAFQEEAKKNDDNYLGNRAYNPDGNANIVASLIEQNYIDRMTEARSLERETVYQTDQTPQELRLRKQQIKRAYDIASEHDREKTAATKAYQKTYHK